jgi:NAD+ diphosphatase
MNEKTNDQLAMKQKHHPRKGPAITINSIIFVLITLNQTIMINEIHPHSLDVLYVSDKTISDGDYVLLYSDRTILLKGDAAAPVIPQWKDFSEQLNKKELIYLFCLDDTNCFLYRSAINTLPKGMQYHTIDLFRIAPQKLGWTMILGFQLNNWYQNHQYCGKCGKSTEPDKKERAIVCKACNTTFYPNISPAIIVAIICKDKILLARGNHFPAGRYSLVAGYTNVGETLEETVIREVNEEVGLEVKNIRYYKNHPWPLSGSLMVGFIAEADDQQPLVIDGNELADAAWFSREELPEHYSAKISISGEMIAKFKNGEI